MYVLVKHRIWSSKNILQWFHHPEAFNVNETKQLIVFYPSQLLNKIIKKHAHCVRYVIANSYFYTECYIMGPQWSL